MGARVDYVLIASTMLIGESASEEDIRRACRKHFCNGRHAERKAKKLFPYAFLEHQRQERVKRAFKGRRGQ